MQDTSVKLSVSTKLSFTAKADSGSLPCRLYRSMHDRWSLFMFILRSKQSKSAAHGAAMKIRFRFVCIPAKS